MNKRAWNVIAVALVAGFPTTSSVLLGCYWERLSGGMQGGFLIGTVLTTLGLFIGSLVALGGD